MHGTSPVEKSLCLWICLTLPVLKLPLFTNSAQSLCGMSTFVPKQKQTPTQYSTKKWNWSGTEAPLGKTKKKIKPVSAGQGDLQENKGMESPLSVQTPSHHPVQVTVCCRLAACRSTTLQDEEHGQKGDFQALCPALAAPEEPARKVPVSTTPSCGPSERSSPHRTPLRYLEENDPPLHTHTHTSASLG